MLDVAISLDSVHKFYGNFEALKSISLEVQKGQIFCCLGPNGSGKTTSIRLILGLTRPSSGSVKVLGQDPYPDSKDSMRTRSRLGVVLERDGLWDKLTGLENIVYWARLYGIEKQIAKELAKNILHSVNLLDWSDKKIGTYSRGMTKRLALARALVTEPDLLVMDEPTTGLDPESRHLIRGIMKELAERGKTIFFSSHDLTDVQKVASDVAFLRRGEIVYKGSLSEVIKKFGSSEFSLEEAYLNLVTGDVA